jgi:hypothetical protein
MIAQEPNAWLYIIRLDITIAQNDIGLATLISHGVQNKSQEVRVVGLVSRE